MESNKQPWTGFYQLDNNQFQRGRVVAEVGVRDGILVGAFSKVEPAVERMGRVGASLGKVSQKSARTGKAVRLLECSSDSLDLIRWGVVIL